MHVTDRSDKAALAYMSFYAQVEAIHNNETLEQQREHAKKKAATVKDTTSTIRSLLMKGGR